MNQHEGHHRSGRLPGLVIIEFRPLIRLLSAYQKNTLLRKDQFFPTCTPMVRFRNIRGYFKNRRKNISSTDWNKCF